MEIVHQILRAIHIAAGITGFFVAPIAMFTKKGGKQHRRWGKIYYWAMIVTTVISVVLAVRNGNAFLFGIGVFSFQMVFQGRRVLLRKRPDRGQVATPVDWIFSVLSFLAGIGLLVYGILYLHILAIIFGAIFTATMTANIYKLFRPSKEKAAWFFDHIRGMTISYITALTAFSATNLNFLPVLVQWLWPTVVIVPILSYVIAKYKRKFAQGAQPKDVAEIRLGLSKN
jgi:uncharacterized membrane protein